MEDYLVEHNDFLSKTMSYCKYISNMREQVDERLNLIERKYKKRFEPKVDKSFEDFLVIKSKYDEIPLIKAALQNKHNEVIKAYKSEIQATNSLTRDCFHNEKDLLAIIETKDEECENIIKEIEMTKKGIELCQKLLDDIQELETNVIPAIEIATAAIIEELNVVYAQIAEEEDNFEGLENVHNMTNDKINELDNEHKLCCDKIQMIDDTTHALLEKKNSFSEIEADERFDEVVKSDFYQQEKGKYMQLQVDSMSITSDINAHLTALNELEKELSKLTEQMENGELEDKNSQFKSEMSQLVELEMDKMEEARLLKEKIESTKREKLKLVNDLETRIILLENRKLHLINVMEEKVKEQKDKDKTDAIEAQKKQVSAPVVVKLGKKKFTQKSENKDVSPSKKQKLDKAVDKVSTKIDTQPKATPAIKTPPSKVQAPPAAAISRKTPPPKPTPNNSQRKISFTVNKKPPIAPKEQLSASSSDEANSLYEKVASKIGRFTYKSVIDDDLESTMDPDDIRMEDSELDTSQDVSLFYLFIQFFHFCHSSSTSL